MSKGSPDKIELNWNELWELEKRPIPQDIFERLSGAVSKAHAVALYTGLACQATKYGRVLAPLPSPEQLMGRGSQSQLNQALADLEAADLVEIERGKQDEPIAYVLTSWPLQLDE
jgi:hypothetical protein